MEESDLTSQMIKKLLEAFPSPEVCKCARTDKLYLVNLVSSISNELVAHFSVASSEAHLCPGAMAAAAGIFLAAASAVCVYHTLTPDEKNKLGAVPLMGMPRTIQALDEIAKIGRIAIEAAELDEGNSHARH